MSDSQSSKADSIHALAAAHRSASSQFRGPTTTISVETETRDALKHYKRDEETWSEFLVNLVAESDRNPTPNND